MTMLCDHRMTAMLKSTFHRLRRADRAGHRFRVASLPVCFARTTSNGPFLPFRRFRRRAFDPLNRAVAERGG